MYSTGNFASGRVFQSRASSNRTWIGAPMAGEFTHSSTCRSVSQMTLRTEAGAAAVTAG